MKNIHLILMILALLAACEQREHRREKDFKIVYNVAVPENGQSNYEVHLMNTDGSGKRNITNHPDVAWTYYAYKDKVYFISDRDTCNRCYFLYEMDSAGRNVRKISELQLEDSWMDSRLEGKKMVVAGRIGKEIRWQLFFIDLKTGDYTQITKDTSAMYRDPVFSPDGKNIVYAYKAQRRDRTMIDELYIMNIDGTNATRLTFYPESDTTAPWYAYHAGPPRWNQKEDFISYQSFQNGKYSLYAVSLDGHKQWKLTDNLMNEGWHDWSSDGQWLVFDGSDSTESQYDIYLMNWKTKVLQKLTDTTYRYQQSPAFMEF